MTKTVDTEAKVIAGTSRSQESRTRWLPYVILTLLILFHVVSNVIWLQQDGRSFYGDTGNHARATMAILDALRTPSLDMLARINRATTFWPPLAYFLAQPLYVLLGVSTDVTAFTTTLWFALAILFTYFIGRRLYGWRTGLLAACLFSFYPAVYLQSRTYYVDIALTAMVLIALYCLLRTDAFRLRKASVLFGIALGLAALTKNAFIIMTIGPILGVAFIGLWSGRRTAWQQLLAWRPGKRLDPQAADLFHRLVNMVLAGVIAVVLAAPWYVSHVFILASNALQVTSAVHLATKPVYWYAAKFDEGVLIWPYLLLVVGLAFGLLRFRRHWFTMVWLISSVIVLTMITRQNVRYLLPVMPAVALLSVDWIVLLPNRLARTALLGFTALVQVFMFFVMSWGAPANWNLALNVPTQDAHNPFNDNTSDRPQAIDPLAFLYYQYPPKAHRWPVASILNTVMADIESSGQVEQANRFISLSKVLDFEYSTFAYETELARTQGRPGAQTLQVADVQQRTDYLIDFLDFDYVLFKSNDKSNMERRQNHIATRQLWASGDEMLRGRFKSLALWKLNDGSYAELFKRQGPPLELLEPDELRPILKRILELTPYSQQAQQMLAQIGFEEPLKPEPISLDQLWQAAARPDPEKSIAPSEPFTPSVVLPDILLALPEVTPLPPSLPDQVRDVGALLDSLAAAAPDDPLAEVRLGAFAIQQGEPPEVAGEHFQRAIDLDPETWLAYGLWANSLSNTGQITQAVQLVGQGLEVMPDSVPLTALQARLNAEAALAPDDALSATLAGGRAALQGRNWADAIAAGQNAVAAAPARYETHLLLGDAYRGAGELAQAVAVYQRAVEMAPHLSILHARVGETQARLGRPAEAVNSSLTALAIDQGRWENWYALGRAFAAQATLSSPVTDLASAQLAESALRQAIELAPPENQAPQRALDDLLAALNPEPQDESQFAPSSADTRAEAETALRAGRAEDALAAFQVLADADPTDTASRMGAAEALAALGRVDEALAAYQQISADFPDFPFAHVKRGELLEQQQDVAAALDAFRAAVEVAPANADVQFTLAFALRRAGLVDEAITAFEAGLALDPNRQTALEALDALRNGS